MGSSIAKDGVGGTAACRGASSIGEMVSARIVHLGIAAILSACLSCQDCRAQCRYEYFPAPRVSVGYDSYALVGGPISDDGVIAGYISSFPSYPAYWDGGDSLTILPQPPGTSDGLVIDILNVNAMVGRVDGDSFGIFWHDGQAEVLPFPDRLYRATANAMNASQQIVGEAVGIDQFGQSQNLIAVMWDGGKYTELEPIPGAWVTRTRAINDRGTIVAYVVMPPLETQTQEVVMWKDGAPMVLGHIPGGMYISPLAINNRDVIVGGDWDPDLDGGRAFLWKQGQFGLLPVPEGTYTSVANDISDTGQIVGYASITGIAHRAMLWQHGVFHDLTDLAVNIAPYKVQFANSVNNHGMMAVELTAGGGLLVPIGSPPADINTDCVVDVSDLLLLLSEWGRPGSFADVDEDGDVDAFDLIEILMNWG